MNKFTERERQIISYVLDAEKAIYQFFDKLGNLLDRDVYQELIEERRSVELLGLDSSDTSYEILHRYVFGDISKEQAMDIIEKYASDREAAWELFDKAVSR